MMKIEIILFLISLLRSSRGQEVCGTLENPKSCVPSWMLIGQNVRKISVSSKCGLNQPEELCSQNNICDTCNWDSYPETNLIDRHNADNNTCWVSGRLKNSFSSPQDAVNITIPFDKRFEIFYISLEHCMESLEDFPDSVAIYKSTDYQRTWKPWHFFSKNCQKAFNLPTSDDFTSLNLFGVYCSSIKPTSFIDPSRITRASHGRRLFGGNKQAYSKAITFSTNFGRQVNSQWSPILNDWMSATDIKISLWKHPRDTLMKRSVTFTKSSNISRIESGEFIALSNIKIAGRCQCNGHAAECFPTMDPSKGVKFHCKCEHNTGGEDCEKCKDSHMDIPWSRATPDNPTICKKCNCNLHSETCRFSNAKFIATNKTHGGVCDMCQDNTTGDNCETCIKGYYRDWSKPISHKDVCIPCNCSPNGALSNSCNPTSGQCFCKEGVSGQQCNRCATGFTFTNNPQQPCISVVDTIPVPRAQQAVPCSACLATRERISLRRFCIKDLFFVGVVDDVKFIDEMVRLDVTASVIWKININEQHKPTSSFFPSWSYHSNLSDSQNINLNVYSLEEVMIKSVNVPIWLSLKDYKCSCPSTQLGQAYLFGLNFNFGHFDRSSNRFELLINQNSVVIPWREAWTQRLNKLRYRTNQGACSFNQARFGHGHRKRHLFQRAINPNNYQNFQRRRRNPSRFFNSPPPPLA